MVKLNVELQEALQDCITTLGRLMNLLEEDREDMPNCINGEILRMYLRGTDGAQEMTRSILADLQEMLAII